MFKVSKITTKNFDMFKVSKITRVRSRHLRISRLRSKVLKKCISKNYIITMTIKIITIKKNFFLSDYIKIVKLTEYEVKLIAKNRGIKDYQSMSREKLLSILDKSERITENLSKYGLNKIVKMQNL